MVHWLIRNGLYSKKLDNDMSCSEPANAARERERENAYDSYPKTLELRRAYVDLSDG